MLGGIRSNTGSLIRPPLPAGEHSCKPTASPSAQEGSCWRSLYSSVVFVKQVLRPFISPLVLLPYFLCLSCSHLSSFTHINTIFWSLWMDVDYTLECRNLTSHGLWKWKPRSSWHPALCFQKLSPYPRCFCYCLDALDFFPLMRAEHFISSSLCSHKIVMESGTCRKFNTYSSIYSRAKWYLHLGLTHPPEIDAL